MQVNLNHRPASRRVVVYLFNFAASYSGGGLKRLIAFSDWFNRNGGAYFIIHPQVSGLVSQFPHNQYFIVRQSNFQRVFNDCAYLQGIVKAIGTPDLYYAYGIPIYAACGKLNWFHLSNVLPLKMKGIPMPISDRIKLGYLGWRIKQCFDQANIISAESKYALDLMQLPLVKNHCVSVNGADEILLDHAKLTTQRDNIAVVVGTYRYKALDDAYRVFKMLQRSNPSLKLVIIGDDKIIPAHLKRASEVKVMGLLDQSEVIKYLLTARYYISTTHIENSSNANLEGIYLAEESYISDIGPHRELLAEMVYETVTIPTLNRPMIHVKNTHLSILNLKSWDTIIREMQEVIFPNLCQGEL